MNINIIEAMLVLIQLHAWTCTKSSHSNIRRRIPYHHTTSLLQDAAKATLRSDTLSRNCVRCINHKRGCKKSSEKVQNICNGGCIKHGSDFSCVCGPGHTVQSNELFAMRRNKRNRQLDERVCDIEHTVHLDELFVIRQHKRNRQPDEGVCDIQHTVTRMSGF